MKKTILAVTFLLSVSMFAMASADGAALYAKCKGCHGAAGEKNALGVSALLKGQATGELFKKMKGYAEGSYGGEKKAIMTGQVKRLSDEEIKALADYIAKF
jgi:cytochrome c